MNGLLLKFSKIVFVSNAVIGVYKELWEQLQS